MRARLAVLAAAHVAIAVAVSTRSHLGATSPFTTAFTAVLFVAAGLLRLDLEHRKGRLTITPSTAVLVGAMATVPAVPLVVAATLGEALSLLLRRVDRFKVLYNGASRAMATAVGAAVFAGLEASGVGTWPAALTATAAFTGASLLATATAIATVEQRSIASVVRGAATTTFLATAVAAPIGLVVIELWHRSAYAPLVLVPTVVAVWVNAAQAAAGRREHQLVARLYAASSSTARLREPQAQADVIAGHVVDLVVATGSACLWRRDGEPWSVAAGGDLLGVPVDEVEALATAALRVPGPEARAAVAPDGDDLLLVATAADAPVEVVLVARRRSEARSPAAELRALQALASEAALALQNSVLLAEIERALERQQDLARDKGEFVASVSHELRTPLAAMSGFVDTILRHGERLGPERVREFLGRSLEQGHRLERLIDDLLVVAAADHARLAAQLGVTDVASVINDVRRTTSGIADGRLQVRVDGELPPVVTDPDKAARILVCLVENAVKYSDGQIRLLAVAAGQQVCLTVEDDGPGIPVGAEGRVFEPFVQLDQTTTRRRGGVGLGLYLSRRLAGAIGGRLELVPSDRGARFELRLPVAEPETGLEPGARPADVSGRRLAPGRHEVFA